MSLVACHMSHGTLHMYFFLHQVLINRELFGGGSVTPSICRTAPTTPGLLIILFQPPQTAVLLFTRSTCTTKLHNVRICDILAKSPAPAPDSSGGHFLSKRNERENTFNNFHDAITCKCYKGQLSFWLFLLVICYFPWQTFSGLNYFSWTKFWDNLGFLNVI